MPVLDRPISEFPRALEVLATALVLISNPSGIDSFDSYSCTLTELGKTILNVEYTQELGQVSVFEAIINLRVLSGTGDPSSSLGVDNQIYVKYQTVGGVDSVTAIYVKLDGTWVEIQTGGGGGATVTLGTTVPSDASGSNGDLYVQYDGTTYAAIFAYVKINNSWRKFPYAKVVALTRAQYNQITPDSQTLYIITDEQSSYQPKTDNTLATTDKTVVGAINELESGKQDNLSVESINITTHITPNAGSFTAYKYGKVCIFRGFARYTNEVPTNSYLCTLSATLNTDYYESVYSSGGSGVRLKLNSNGKVETESRILANEYISITIVAFLA